MVLLLLLSSELDQIALEVGSVTDELQAHDESLWVESLKRWRVVKPSKLLRVGRVASPVRSPDLLGNPPCRE